MKKSLAAKVLPKSVQDDIDRQIEPHLKVRASGVGLCSTKTGKERRMHIRASVAQLWVLGYRILKLASLSQKHVQALMTYWEKEGRSAEFLHNRLSALRTLAGWLGKRNVVLDMEDYFPRERTQRHAATRVNLSWTANGVDPLKMIEFAKSIDERLAVMLSLQHFFGFRVKESIEIRPGNALIDGGRTIEVFEGAPDRQDSGVAPLVPGNVAPRSRSPAERKFGSDRSPFALYSRANAICSALILNYVIPRSFIKKGGNYRE